MEVSLASFQVWMSMGYVHGEANSLDCFQEISG